MSTMIDVYRHHLGGAASQSDVELSARLANEAVRYEQFRGDTPLPDCVFELRPSAITAYNSGDAEAFAWAIGVPWPVPERVTVQSLAAELDALAAKFKAFAAI